MPVAFGSKSSLAEVPVFARVSGGSSGVTPAINFEDQHTMTRKSAVAAWSMLGIRCSGVACLSAAHSSERRYDFVAGVTKRYEPDHPQPADVLRPGHRRVGAQQVGSVLARGVSRGSTGGHRKTRCSTGDAHSIKSTHVARTRLLGLKFTTLRRRCGLEGVDEFLSDFRN